MSTAMCHSPNEAAAFLQAATGYTVAFELTRHGEICDNAFLFDSDQPGWCGLLPVSSLPLIRHLFNREMCGHVDRMVAQYKAEQAGLSGSA